MFVFTKLTIKELCEPDCTNSACKLSVYNPDLMVQQVAELRHNYKIMIDQCLFIVICSLVCCLLNSWRPVGPFNYYIWTN